MYIAYLSRFGAKIPDVKLKFDDIIRMEANHFDKDRSARLDPPPYPLQDVQKGGNQQKLPRLAMKIIQPSFTYSLWS